MSNANIGASFPSGSRFAEGLRSRMHDIEEGAGEDGCAAPTVGAMPTTPGFFMAQLWSVRWRSGNGQTGNPNGRRAIPRSDVAK